MNKKKLKIIQTPARFYPNIGGVNKYVLDLSEQLVKIGHEVKVICSNEPSSKIKNIFGIEVKRLKYWFKIANTNITPFLFFKLLKEDFDIIHTHIPTPWSADISMLVSIIKKKPLILTYHNDLIKNGIAKYIALIYNATLLKILFKKSKKIIITSSNYINHSNYLKNQIDKIVVIPNGVDLEEFKLDKNNKKVEYQIFFLSVLDIHHKYKGLDYLLYAMPDVIKQFPKTKLLIGGKGGI
ncbi:unnamed protein product [marine sediment metagenome]|uniref:Glycosyltransferase subfamily 4-like N-terminal domain-containing protein n=1 Tax=marine sediment metagenome TaxID=412755 RepID=X1UFR5_9ZZZZ